MPPSTNLSYTEHSELSVEFQVTNGALVVSEQFLYFGGCAVPDLYPDNLRRRPQKNAHIAKVSVFRDDSMTVLGCVIPDLSIGGATHAQ